jgi:hypothetical protein
MQEKARPEALLQAWLFELIKGGNHEPFSLSERGGTLLFNENDFQYHCNPSKNKSQHKS